MPALIICIVITVADQFTKHIIQTDFRLGEVREIVPGFFNLTYLRNTGAAWGMLSNYSHLLMIVSVVMLALMIFFRRSFLTDTWEHRIALGLLTGGIVGNLIDRIKFGHVTDFLDFHIKNHHWPSFNIADSAICIGVGIYIISSYWLTAHPLNESGKTSTLFEPALIGVQCEFFRSR